jgi:hypothetical protein
MRKEQYAELGNDKPVTGSFRLQTKKLYLDSRKYSFWVS